MSRIGITTQRGLKQTPAYLFSYLLFDSTILFGGDGDPATPIEKTAERQSNETRIGAKTF